MSVDWVLDPNSGEMRPVEALSPAVLERFDKPRNYGPLESFGGHARITGPCGDTMEFWIQVMDKRIASAGFTTTGCGTSRAAGSMATELALDKPIREAGLIEQADILDALGGLPKDAEHCALLASNTLKAAIRDYQTKRDPECGKCSKTSCPSKSHRPDGSNDPSNHHHSGKSSESLLDKAIILRHLGIVPGQAILDAGCGSGYMSREFAALVGTAGKVYALDPDEIAMASLREETRNLNIEAITGDITTTTQLPSSAFDLVYLSMVIHGFSATKVKGFEMEVTRLLKSGGKLAIVEVAKRETPFGPPMNIRFSSEELKQTLNLIPKTTVDVGEHCYMQLFEKE